MCDPVAEPVNVYLRTIGRFETPEGKPYRFCMAKVVRRLYGPSPDMHDHVTGFFGRVTAGTHSFYEAYPAPGVSLLRVIKDYVYTTKLKDQNVESDWDLPDSLRPILESKVDCAYTTVQQGPNLESNSDLSEGPSQIPMSLQQANKSIVPIPVTHHSTRYVSHPTRCMLGWARATQLTLEQCQTIEQCGIEECQPMIDCPKYAFNKVLFKTLAARIRARGERFKIVSSSLEHQSGSIAKVAYIEHNIARELLSRDRFYCEGTVGGASHYQLDQRLAVAARWSGLRIHRISHERNGAAYNP